MFASHLSSSSPNFTQKVEFYKEAILAVISMVMKLLHLAQLNIYCQLLSEFNLEIQRQNINRGWCGRGGEGIPLPSYTRKREGRT